MKKIDLDDVERKTNRRIAARTRRAPDPEWFEATSEYLDATSEPVMLALVARIRELQGFIASIPSAALGVDKIFRDDFPELFTDEDGAALYMDEAKHRILKRGTVLP